MGTSRHRDKPGSSFASNTSRPLSNSRIFSSPRRQRRANSSLDKPRYNRRSRILFPSKAAISSTFAMQIPPDIGELYFHYGILYATIRQKTGEREKFFDQFSRASEFLRSRQPSITNACSAWE